MTDEKRILIVRMPTSFSLGALATEMGLRGWETRELDGYADEAYDILSQDSQDSIVLVEPMITGSKDEAEGKYNRTRTFDFTTTGLCLLDDLIKSNPKQFPEHALIHAAVSPHTDLFNTISRFSYETKIPVLHAAHFETFMDLGEEIERQYKRIFG